MMNKITTDDLDTLEKAINSFDEGYIATMNHEILLSLIAEVRSSRQDAETVSQVIREFGNLSTTRDGKYFAEDVRRPLRILKSIRQK